MGPAPNSEVLLRSHLYPFGHLTFVENLSLEQKGVVRLQCLQRLK